MMQDVTTTTTMTQDVTAMMQDVTTMMRQGLNAVIFLINNRGYTIEVEIHDGAPSHSTYPLSHVLK